jgi:hypothetical protein
VTNLVPVLRTQFNTVWSLFKLHLDALTEDDGPWSPAPAEHTWSVREDSTGTWVPDWADTEPEPLPVATIDWLTWHIGWWWTTAIVHATGRPVPDRTDVTWPGSVDAARTWLADLHKQWNGVLDGLTDADLSAQATFPWSSRPDRTVADMVAWVNIELMKNAAEVGQLRIARSAAAARRDGWTP